LVRRHAGLALAGEVRVTVQTKTSHLIERAAKHLRGLEELTRSAPLPPAPSEEAPAARSAPLSPAAFVPPPPLEFAVLEQAGMIPWGRKRDRVAEEFRLVQSQVLRQLDAVAKPGQQSAGLSNLVMITSSRPNEGKSFVALNLAAAIAHFGGRQVLLVDADAKHTSLSHHLNLTEQPGLLDFGAGLMPRPEGLVVPTRLETLSILPIGGVGPGRGDLAAKVSIATTVERLARRFSSMVIMLDAPPCLSTSDPSALAPVVGQIVFVVEAERTKRGEVESSLDLIAACPTITLLLNKSQLTTKSTFGAYYY
jgi:receptor protein-tyrosine kinase